MSTLTQLPTMINASSDTDLSANQVVTGPNSGFVVAGPNFAGYALTLQSGFAADLYTALNSPSLLYSYPVTFSCGHGNTFKLEINDSDLIVSNSTTIEYNYGNITSMWQPTLLFVLTQTSPPQFTIYG